MRNLEGVPDDNWSYSNSQHWCKTKRTTTLADGQTLLSSPLDSNKYSLKRIFPCLLSQQILSLHSLSASFRVALPKLRRSQHDGMKKRSGWKGYLKRILLQDVPGSFWPSSTSTCYPVSDGTTSENTTLIRHPSPLASRARTSHAQEPWGKN